MNSDSKNLDNVTVESHGETEVGDVLTLRFRVLTRTDITFTSFGSDMSRKCSKGSLNL